VPHCSPYITVGCRIEASHPRTFVLHSLHSFSKREREGNPTSENKINDFIKNRLKFSRCYNIIMYNFNKIWINNNSWKYRTQKPFLNLHNGSKIFVGAVHGIISLPQLAQIYCTNVQAATKSLYYIVKLVIIIRIITIFTILVTHVKTNIKFSSQEQHKCHKKLLGIVWPR
jgi:hypothetical protein